MENKLITALREEEKRLFREVENIRNRQAALKDPLWGKINELSYRNMLVSYRNLLEMLNGS